MSDWTVACVPRNGATCPGTSDLNRLSLGQTIATWPAGGALTVIATGTAPAAAAGGNAALTFSATVANANGSPDVDPGNDISP